MSHIINIMPADDLTTKASGHLQTPEDWEDSLERKRKALHKRSASLGNGDTRKEVKHWSKKTDLNRGNSGHRSPVHGGHLSLLTTLPPSSGPAHLTSKTVGIPVSSKRSVIRIRGSVEGPSTEIERALNISGTDELQLRTSEALPDGHRAPVTELLASGVRSVDTQTPLGYIDETRTRGEQQSPLSEGEEPVVSSSGSSSRASHSGSPSCPIIVGQMDSSRPSSVSDSSLNGKESDKENECDGDHSERLPEKDLSSLSPEELKCVPSPKPNKSFSFVREPPDGCEKVKMVEEVRSAPRLKEPLMYCPVQKPGPFRIPSQDSAFNPPFKLCPAAPVAAPLTVATHLDN